MLMCSLLPSVLQSLESPLSEIWKLESLLDAEVARQDSAWLINAGAYVQGALSGGEAEAQGSNEAIMKWQARCAVLSALATYLHASPSVQRAAVRKWEPVAALFGLLWDDSTRKIALSMVRHAHEIFLILLIYMPVPLMRYFARQLFLQFL